MLVLAVNGGIDTGPLHPIPGTFRPTGLAGQGGLADDACVQGLTCDVAETAPHANGVAAHSSLIGSRIVQDDDAAAVQFKASQVNPGAAAHLLIDQ